MSSTSVRCRLVACPIPPTGRWDFVLVNDGQSPLDATLVRVAYEWGGMGHSDPVEVRVGPLAPGESAIIWHDNGFGVEGRMDLHVQVHPGTDRPPILFEFPLLYRKTDLPMVDGLGRPGWELTASS